MSAADLLAAEVGDVVKPKLNGRAAPISAKGTLSDDGWFRRCNELDTRAVAEWLGLRVWETGRMVHVECPGNPDHECAIVTGGAKCMHDTCADAGLNVRGLRSNVDLVVARRGCSPKEAAAALSEAFGVERPKARGLGQTEALSPASAWDDGPPPQAYDAEPPRAADPLAFLTCGTDVIFRPLPPVPWAVEGLRLCPGAVSMVAGFGYSGKTVAAQAMAVSIAAGVPVWDRFACRQGRVLHVDYEQGSRLTFERYQRLARGLEIEQRELDGRLRVAVLPTMRLDSVEAEATLSRAAEGCVLGIVDSLRAGAPTLDENASEIRIPLDMLSRVSERTGCAWLVLHHARKPSQDATGGARMSIRGSGALYDACSSVLVFEGRKNEPVLVHHEKDRATGQTLEDFELRIFDRELGGDPRGGLVVRAERVVPDSEEMRAAAALDGAKGAVVRVLREHGPLTKNGLVERVGRRRATVIAAADELVAEEQVRIAGGRYEVARRNDNAPQG